MKNVARYSLLKPLITRLFSGNAEPSVGEFVYYIPELWWVTSVVSPGVYRVEGCLSKTRKVAQLSALAPAYFCSRASRAAQLEGEVRR